MSILDTIIKAITLPLKIIIGLFLFTLIVVFLPTEWVKAFGLTAFLEMHKIWFIFSSLLFGSIIFVYIAYGIGNKIKICMQKRERKKLEKKKNENIEKKLYDLDHIEKAVLREFLIKGTYTIKLPVMEPAVASLIKYNILETVDGYQQITMFGPLRNIKISEYANSKLTDEMFGLPDRENLTETEIRNIHNKRPKFMVLLDRIMNIHNY